MAAPDKRKRPSKEVLDAIFQVMDGGNPEEIARRIGMETDQLLAQRDSFLEHAHRELLLGEAATRKIGRNEPCPCGSGKKYKRCCLPAHEKARSFLRETRAQDIQQEEAKEGLPEHAARGFDLLAAGRYSEALAYAADLLREHPDDDRLHDTLASAHLALGNYQDAVAICRARWQVAAEEKAFYLAHGHHQRQQLEEGAAPPHFYAPETWLEKYWISSRAGEYRGLLPESPNPHLNGLIEELLTANDLEKFPEQQEEGLQRRREALQPTLRQLEEAGADAVPYLLQVVHRYSWAILFVPELLAHHGSDLAIRSLIDISMFGYHFASEARRRRPARSTPRPRGAHPGGLGRSDPRQTPASRPPALPGEGQLSHRQQAPHHLGNQSFEEDQGR
jgi:hypothetical protein